MFKLNTILDADFLLYLLSHFECDGHTVHMLTRWPPLPPLTSTVKSSFSQMCIPVHCPWLTGCNDVVVQTILILLIMAGLLSDRPHILYHKMEKK